MLCQNPDCRKQIDDDSTFCVSCGTSQTSEEETIFKQIPKPDEIVSMIVEKVQPKQSPPQQRVTNQNTIQSKVAQPTESQDLKFIEFRASDNIWNFTESEPIPRPEQRRPVLILDEKTILLSETNKMLSAEELLYRVQMIIQEKQVPVETYIMQARWINDVYEIRPRIIASLKDHAYSGLKMILGLDYMGNWATLHFQIGMQPDPVPKPPPKISSQSEIPMLMIIGGILIAVFAAFIFLGSGAAGSGGGAFLGLLFLIGGIVLTVLGFKMKSESDQTIDAEIKEKQKYEQNEYQRALYKAKMDLFRTFKIDDAMLFNEAMNKIFMQVVDDLIEQGGGKIVKEIEGGDTKLFADTSNQANNQPNPVQSSQTGKTDASKIGV